MKQRVAVFIDGENIGSTHAEAIATRAGARGTVVIARVYGDVGRLNGWQEAVGYGIFHAGRGKNATDLLLSLDALGLAMEGRFDVCVLASSDRDFSHLAVKLREHGIRIVGTGPEAASSRFVGHCSEFETLTCRTAQKAANASGSRLSHDFDSRVREVVAQYGSKGVRITDLNPIMRRDYDLRISERSERTWRGYLTSKPDLYALDPKGPESRVRLVRQMQ